MNTVKSQQAFAKLMAAACVRRGYLETLHSGITPVTKTGDYSDVRVIPWNELSRIDQAEMKTLMTGVVDRIYTFLMRTLFSADADNAFVQALERAAAPWVREWNAPNYLDDFLMPRGDRRNE